MQAFLLNRLFPFLFILAIFLLGSFDNRQIETISIRMEKQSLHKGRPTITVADINYQRYNGRIVKNYIKPEGKIAITNQKGEFTIYDKKNDQIFSEQNPEYNTEDNILFFVFSNNVLDAEKSEMGFQLKNNEINEDHVVTQWLPPQFMQHLFSYVEVTYNEELPFLAEYYDLDENLVVKTYFTDYKEYAELDIPHTLTEFIYINENDSIVNKVSFSDFQIGDKSKIELFDFEVPDDLF